MLVTNPRRINHEQLRILARNAKGGINHIYLHWTAGTYEQVFDDYHINIGEQGELYLTCNMLREYKEHTWHRNSKAIAITLCCAKDAILAYKCNPVFGAYPPKCCRWNRWRWLSLSCVMSWNWKSTTIQF